MSTVVIIGAGSVGGYVATHLSKLDHNVVVVDTDSERLDILSSDVDLAVRAGSGTDFRLLDNLLEFSPEFFIALTDSDESNLVGAAIAKQLNYPKTIARLRDDRFLNTSRLDFGRIFGVDHYICPEALTASEMFKKIESANALLVEQFSHGAIEMRTLLIKEEFGMKKVPLEQLPLPEGVMIGLIVRRGEELLFPHGKDYLLPSDEVTFILDTEKVQALYEFLSLEEKMCRSITLFGGGRVGTHLAKMASNKGMEVIIVEKGAASTKRLAEELPSCKILYGQELSRDFLLQEGLCETDAQVFCGSQDEANIVGALIARELGGKQVSVTLSDPSLSSFLSTMGIHHLFSPRRAALNAILPLLIRGKITSLVSLYENRVEIAEIRVSPDSPWVGIPLSDLGPYLPKDLLICMIQNRGRIMVAHGGRIMSPGDTVTVITTPGEMAKVQEFF